MATHARPTLKRRRFLQGAGAGAVAMAVGQLPAAAQTTTVMPAGVAAPSGRRFRLVLDEGWNSIDTSLWYRYLNTYGDSGNTLQYHLPRNLVTSNGSLKIYTKRETYTGALGKRYFTSGFISTGARGTVGDPHPAQATYFPREGYYEMRGKVAHAQGVWNGWWLRHRAGASEAEVDIMETFHAQIPGRTAQTLHLNNTGTTQYNIFHRNTYIEDPQAPPGWHIWGVLINAEGDDVRFTFYTDGKAVGSFLAPSPHFWHSYSSPDLWDLSLDTFASGTWIGHPDDALGYSRYLNRCLSSGTSGSCSTTGINRSRISSLSSSPGAEKFQISWVRVWQVV